jgi:multidrug efflux pump subunit AcrA (membrane-fusion protein)
MRVTASLYQDQRVLARPRGSTADEVTGRRPGRSRPGGRRRRWQARQTTASQRFLGLTVAVACALGCGWYVRQVVTADRAMLTGSVASTGVVDLNFATAGVVAKVLVRVGQRVRANQLLATESAPGAAAVVTADAAAVKADKEQLSAVTGTASAAAVRAQLARDQARLAADKLAAGQRRIVAPAAGVVTAVDAQPGQSAAPAGITDYTGQESPVDPRPLFSLLPKSPQVSTKAGMNGSAVLPMIQLRTSGDWQVLALVPESSAAAVRAGQPVRVSVPAAGLAGQAGVIKEVLAAPVLTADGNMYEAVVTMRGGGADPPLEGMTADVALQPPAGQAARR